MRSKFGTARNGRRFTREPRLGTRRSTFSLAYVRNTCDSIFFLPQRPPVFGSSSYSTERPQTYLAVIEIQELPMRSGLSPHTWSRTLPSTVLNLDDTRSETIKWATECWSNAE